MLHRVYFMSIHKPPQTENRTPQADGSCLSPGDRGALLGTARESIREGLRTGRPLEVDASAYGPALAAPRATFVTLHLRGGLRGCIGALEASRPLIADAARHAYAAAFRDPRFPPVTAGEVEALELHISIIGPPEPLAARDEPALLAQLRPAVDGLILEETGGGRGRRSTFLPEVWETLPEPRRFLEHLKAKAGLPPDYWSPTLRFWRYATESVGE